MSVDSSTPIEPNGAFRTDVREATEAAAAAEFRFNSTCLALVSVSIVDELMKGWCLPVQIMAERNNNGLVELVMRDAE